MNARLKRHALLASEKSQRERERARASVVCVCARERVRHIRPPPHRGGGKGIEEGARERGRVMVWQEEEGEEGDVRQQSSSSRDSVPKAEAHVYTNETMLCTKKPHTIFILDLLQ